jgi:RNA polymerase sigma-70 factor (ECF subfamily)
MRYRREKLREWEPLEDDVGGAGEDVPLRLDLEAALGRLPERSRAVVWLHDVEGYTHEEIAELMGMTTSFSKSQLARAHDRLRRWLGAGAGA